MSITTPTSAFGEDVSLSFVRMEHSEGYRYFKPSVSDKSGEQVYLEVACEYETADFVDNTGVIQTAISWELLDRFLDERLLSKHHVDESEFSRPECVLCMSGEIEKWYSHPQSRDAYGIMHLECYRELCDEIERYVEAQKENLVVDSI